MFFRVLCNSFQRPPIWRVDLVCTNRLEVLTLIQVVGNKLNLSSILLNPHPSQFHQRGRQDKNTPSSQPRQPQCQACSNRLPHEASSTYQIAEYAVTAATGYRCPPGAPRGTLFAVMDPLRCRCAAAGLLGIRGESGRGGVITKKMEAGGAGGGGGDGGAVHGKREVYDPPVLWPVNGEKFAFRREQGPVEHGLRLESAYAQQGDAWGTGEPAFSTYHHMFKVTTLTFTGQGWRIVIFCM